MTPLYYISRRLARYVFRSLRRCSKTRHRIPTLVMVLALVYLISVFLTTRLMMEPKLREWEVTDVAQLRESCHPDLGSSYLPYPFQQGHGGVSARVAVEYDPRLIPALWLNRIAKHVQNEELGFGSDLVLPFRWESFLDLLPRVVSPPLAPTTITSCDLLRKVFHLNGNYGGDFCKQTDVKSTISGFPQVAVTAPIDRSLTERARVFIGANYLMNLNTTPERAVLLGVGPGTKEKKALVARLEGIPSTMQRLDLTSLVESYLEQCEDCNTISVSEQIEKLQSSWTVTDGEISFQSGFDLLSDNLHVAVGSHEAVQSLHPEDFSITVDLLQRYFDLRVFSRVTSVDSLDRKLAVNLGDLESTDMPGKYFHEAQLVGTSRGSHFDWRFFKRSHYSTYEHQAILHRLSRAWLRFTNVAGLNSWLAHGTLLGWYWNGLNMPWDQDLDVQMSMRSLFLLARNYNQTVVVDYSDDSDLTSTHLYYLDVSPYIYKREHGNGKNVIDARFIDMDSGMYVDITGLAVTKDYLALLNATLSRNSDKLHKVFDSEYANAIKSALEDSEFVKTYMHELNEIETASWEDGFLYNCKNFHFYNMLELEPLRKTSFEGEVAYVPAKFEEILKREYPRGTIAREYQSWIFRPHLGLWVHKTSCKNDYWGDKCQDETVLLEEKLTRPFRLSRKNWFGTNSDSSIRADPWMMQRNELLCSI